MLVSRVWAVYCPRNKEMENYRALSPGERNYAITELETLAVVWAVTHFRAYLYGSSVAVYTDHSAVKSVLLDPHAVGKHARWWSWVFNGGLKEIEILYRPRKENACADALSWHPHQFAPEEGVAAQVMSTTVDIDIGALLNRSPETWKSSPSTHSIVEEQSKDQELCQIRDRECTF